MCTFCLACPQRGFNVPEDGPECARFLNLHPWMATDEICSILDQRVIMLDGNFEAQHEAMKVPENDVELTNGTGIMANSVQYQQYLSANSGPEPVEVGVPNQDTGVIC